jgi:hypothetical protein
LVQPEFKAQDIAIECHRFFEVRDVEVGLEESAEQSCR